MIVRDMVTIEGERVDEPPQPDAADERPALSDLFHLGLWGARGLILLTVVVIALSLLCRPVWELQGYDEHGFPRNAVPNIAVALVFICGICGPWLSGLAASPTGAWRNGDTLFAITVLGRRRVQTAGAHVVPLRVPGRGGTTCGAFILDRRLRPLVLLEPFSDSGPSRIDRLVGRRATRGAARIALEYLYGLVFLCAAVVITFVLCGLAAWWIGVIS